MYPTGPYAHFIAKDERTIDVINVKTGDLEENIDFHMPPIHFIYFIKKKLGVL